MPNSTGEDNFLGRKNACPLNLIETSPHIDGNSKPDWGIESNRDNNYPGPMNARDDNVDYAREIITITTRPNRPTGDNYKFCLMKASVVGWHGTVSGAKKDGYCARRLQSL